MAELSNEIIGISKKINTLLPKNSPKIVIPTIKELCV